LSAAPANSVARKRKRWWLRIFVSLLVLLVVLIGAGILGLQEGWFNGPIRNAIVRRIEQATQGRVELAGFHFDLFALRATLDGLTIHEREPAGTPPFFHADSIDVQLHLISFWHRKINLRDLVVVHPQVHLEFAKDGTSNLPVLPPPKPGAKPFRQQIFDLAIGHLALEDGTILYNNQRVPLVVEGNNFNFALDWGQPSSGLPLYLGKLSWTNFSVADKKYLPVGASVSMKFTFAPDEFSVDQMRLTTLQSAFDVQADVKNLAKPTATFRYRGALDLADLRAWMRKPGVPGGMVDFNGSGKWDGKDWDTQGRYAARDIALHFQWFHQGGMTSRGDYRASRGELVVPNFEAHAFDGSMKGRVNLVFAGMKFRVVTHGEGMSLSEVLSAVDNPSLPVNPLHWDGALSVDATTTWSQGFQHVTSAGTTVWDLSNAPKVGMIPATAHIDYDYSEDLQHVTIRSGEIDTPSSKVTMNGILGAKDSALDVAVNIHDLAPWNDFINRIRGPKAEPVKITGSATYQGKLTGPLGGPEFAGHVHLLNAAYGTLYWDEAEGDMTYSPTQFKLERARATRGNSSAQIELAMQLDNWNFAPDAAWTFDAAVVRTPMQGLQQLFGWNYPVTGSLTGQFHLRGTRSDPLFNGLFDIANLEAWGWRASHARGEIILNHEEARINNADIQLTPPPGSENTSAGTLTGSAGLRFDNRTLSFDLTGAAIPIEDIGRIQTARLPLGGHLSFQLHGTGPLLSPNVDGSIRIVDLRAGNEVLGSFDGKLNSDGRRLRLDVSSALPVDRLRGWVELGLSGNFPVTGELDANQLDIDPLIEAGLHLNALTGHSSMSGHLKLQGAAMQPETITVDANISHLSFGYEYVKLENNGPLEFQYSQNEVRVLHANFKSTGSDFTLEGMARFAGARTLAMDIDGTVDLRLLGGFIPSLDIRGSATINTKIQGTLDRPQIVGRMQVQDVSANYGDFPVGLSKVTGTFVFDASRMNFSDVHAEIGGGVMNLSGNVSYAEGMATARYDITSKATNVRIRYPEGMSWLANGTLRFSGNLQAAQLAGNVTIQRVLMSQGFDLASLIGSSTSPLAAPLASSAFLRNLQFEIQADSAPDARVEWNGARFDADANMRVRGTWENPILLGHISLRNGEITFAGNKYSVTRGDIDFANPFRLDPVLSIQATTTISQYQVTLDLSGPADHLNLSYRSDPPLPTTDIVSLLALGSPTTSSQYATTSGGASNSQMGATTLLSEAISSQLGGRVEKLFGITSFRVDPFLAETGTEQNEATRVTVQQQVSKNVTVTYSSNVTGSQEQLIQIEYHVRPDLSIIALRDINGIFSLDVVRKIRFK
jgi:translocation and assembly module TamB